MDEQHNIICEWPIDLSCLPDDVNVVEHSEQVQLAVQTATEVLWALTGRQFGVCEDSLLVRRDSRVVCTPTLANGVWRNIDTTSTTWANLYSLPSPVYDVTRVVDADGNDLDFVVEVAGVKVLGAAERIDYLRGRPFPPSAAKMAGELASQLYLQCVGDKRCRLPRNATSVQRQGVSVQMTSPAEIVESGMTGLVDVDLWVKAHNPHGLAQDSEVIF